MVKIIKLSAMYVQIRDVITDSNFYANIVSKIKKSIRLKIIYQIINNKKNFRMKRIQQKINNQIRIEKKLINKIITK